MTDKIVLQFSTSPAWQSGIIRFMCHSSFSHVDVILPEPVPHGCLGASDPGGVAIRPHNYQEFKWRQRATIYMPEPGMADKFLELVMSQLGKPFDPQAMHAVLDDTPRDWTQPDAWFCSEIITWALDECGFFDWIRQMLRRLMNPQLKAWHAAELVATSLETAGIGHNSGIIVPKNRVTPGDLLLLLNPWIDPAEFYVRI